MEANGNHERGLVETAAGLARIYASAWWHTAEWTVESSVKTGGRLVGAALGGRPAGELLEGAVHDLREYARGLLGDVDEEAARTSADGRGAREDNLKERGAELLRRSADVSYREEAHPAYERILEALAPDEGRILRLLATHGPQPAVDVRSGVPHVQIASGLVEPGLTMIGAHAGVRFPDRVKPYLNNLERLGLIWFSREPVKDSLRYQVVEAQPEVVDAMRRGGRFGHTVRRSILLTPFGRDFCEVCLPLDTEELEALPGDFASGEPDAGPLPASDAAGPVTSEAESSPA